MRLKIASRKSELAKLQAYRVGSALKSLNPDLQIEYQFRESLGDKNLNEPLWKSPEKGVFTEDFFQDLLNEKSDLVVHSWKDLPTENKSETLIAATLPRADQRDLFLFKKSSMDAVMSSRQIRIFTSSPRRIFNLEGFLKNHLPFTIETVHFESVRGNIQTRLKKTIENNNVDGLIVAKAAIDRLLTAQEEDLQTVRFFIRKSLEKMDWMVLPLSANPSAAAQGAIAIEIKKNRKDLFEFVQKMNDVKSFESCVEERKILKSHGGGCHQKIGVSVLKKEHFDIVFLKGETDHGIGLNTVETKRVKAPPRFQKIWSSQEISQSTVRYPMEFSIPENKYNALFISKSDAASSVTKGFSQIKNFKGILWTAGVGSWKKLAQMGFWIHGCQDTLGEDEDFKIEALVGEALKWAKLSHAESYSTMMDLIPTYQMGLPSMWPNLRDYEAFYWTSPLFFKLAFEKFPEIHDKHHSCGLGNTYKEMNHYLQQRGFLGRVQLEQFIDSRDWRKHVDANIK